jgi:hypothetical protein
LNRGDGDGDDERMKEKINIYTHMRRPLTHYKKKCGYFLVNFLRNIGIQQTHTIRYPLFSQKEFNVV